MEKNGAGNGYISHLEELRSRIIFSLFFFVIIFIAGLFYIDKVSLFLQEPIKSFDIKLYYFKPYEKFMAYMKVDAVLSLIISIPFLLYQVWAFVRPALERKEKNIIGAVVISVPVIFIGGVAFAFKFIAPAALKFFVEFSAGDNVMPVWSFGDYFDMVIGFCIVTGALFQMPLILVAVISAGIVSVKTVASYRKYIIILIAVFSGVFSPGPDIFSQIMIGIPLYIMFEIALITGRIVELKKRKAN